jgi:hypothetical protein
MLPEINGSAGFFRLIVVLKWQLTSNEWKKATVSSILGLNEFVTLLDEEACAQKRSV